MRVLIQRCLDAKCVIDNQITGQINHGYVLFVGFTENDNKDLVNKMTDKIINMRIFEDENQKMNKSILDIDGGILSISQFTLYADPYNGRRPSFTKALNPKDADILYIYFNGVLEQKLSKKVQTGVFGADMKISLTNDGPCTIFLDSKYF